MSYHTFELRYQLTYQEKETLINIFKKKGKVYVDNLDFTKSTICEALSNKGINIKFNQYTKNDFTFNMMYIKINPRRVMDHNNYIGIFDSHQTSKMLKKLTRILNL